MRFFMISPSVAMASWWCGDARAMRGGTEIILLLYFDKSAGLRKRFSPFPVE
jgi:hypothetical protein